MIIKRYAEDHSVQKAARTKSDNPYCPSLVPMEITQSSAPVESAEKTEKTKKKKGTNAKKQPAQKKKKVKAKKSSKNSSVVENTAEYSLVSALADDPKGLFWSIVVRRPRNCKKGPRTSL